MQALMTGSFAALPTRVVCADVECRIQYLIDILSRRDDPEEDTQRGCDVNDERRDEEWAL